MILALVSRGKLLRTFDVTNTSRQQRATCMADVGRSFHLMLMLKWWELMWNAVLMISDATERKLRDVAINLDAQLRHDALQRRHGQCRSMCADRPGVPV